MKHRQRTHCSGSCALLRGSPQEAGHPSLQAGELCKVEKSHTDIYPRYTSSIIISILEGGNTAQVFVSEEEAWTYYWCRSEAVSRGLKEGALCNKPNKEVIDRSTGRSPPARTEAGALATARFSLLFFSVVHALVWVSVLRTQGS